MKKKNIFFCDYLFNGIVAAPIAFLTGGPGAAAVVLGLAVASAKKEIDDEKVREYNRKHPQYKPISIEEINQERIEQLEAGKVIEKIMEDAEEIPGIHCRKKHPVFERIIINRAGTVSTHLKNHHGIITIFYSNGNPPAVIPVIKYGKETDYLERLQQDIQHYTNIKKYKIVDIPQSSWMYTVDGGKTFILKV